MRHHAILRKKADVFQRIASEFGGIPELLHSHDRTAAVVREAYQALGGAGAYNVTATYDVLSKGTSQPFRVITVSVDIGSICRNLRSVINGDFSEADPIKVTVNNASTGGKFRTGASLRTN